MARHIGSIRWWCSGAASLPLLQAGEAPFASTTSDAASSHSQEPTCACGRQPHHGCIVLPHTVSNVAQSRTGSSGQQHLSEQAVIRASGLDFDMGPTDPASVRRRRAMRAWQAAVLVCSEADTNGLMSSNYLVNGKISCCNGTAVLRRFLSAVMSRCRQSRCMLHVGSRAWSCLP